MSGSVTLGGVLMTGRTVAQLARQVGYVFQHPDHQIFKRSVRDEVSFGPRNLGLDTVAVRAATDAALAATGPESLAEQYPHELLLSQRKLVALASVLAMGTPVVVLDEPTTGQDADGLQLMDGILERLKEKGRTLITVSHDMDFCADHCGRSIVMDEGRVALDGPPELVFADTDLLADSGVEPPQLTRLAQSLGLPPIWDTEALLTALAMAPNTRPPS